jgi:UPF0271 protein
MVLKEFDINADLGEGCEIEDAIMPFLNSCNIACGGHRGNLKSIKKVVTLAQVHQVKIGAHPSYPDKENFGREEMKLDDSVLYQSLLNQIKLLLEVIPTHTLHHIKPHGALYHSCANDIKTATILLDIIKELCPKAIVFTLPDSPMEKLAQARGIKIWREAFIDRAYQNNGQLVPRSNQKAVLKDSNSMYQQFYYLVQKNKVKTIDHSWINLNHETLCIHGDHPKAVENLKILLNLFEQKKEPLE